MNEWTFILWEERKADQHHRESWMNPEFPSHLKLLGYKFLLIPLPVLPPISLEIKINDSIVATYRQEIYTNCRKHNCLYRPKGLFCCNKISSSFYELASWCSWCTCKYLCAETNIRIHLWSRKWSDIQWSFPSKNIVWIIYYHLRKELFSCHILHLLSSWSYRDHFRERGNESQVKITQWTSCCHVKYE